MEAVVFEQRLVKRVGAPVVTRLKAVPGLYLVGGIVRDVLIDRPNLDIDLITTQMVPEDVIARFDPIVRVQFQVNDRFHTRRAVLDNGLILDVTGLGDLTLDADMFRRDFTINALAVSLSENRWLDLSGGEADLQSRTLRMVSPRNLEDDPLRLLRAVRLKWELGFALEPRTRETIMNLAPRVIEAAPERIQDELQRLFALSPIGSIVRDLYKFNLLFALFPDMKPMASNPASPLSKLSVLDHTLLALDALDAILSNPADPFGAYGPRILDHLQSRHAIPLLRLALLLHDIAKPITQAEIDGNLTFYGHDHVGAALVGKMLENYRFPSDAVEFITTVIRGHLRIGFYSNEQDISPRKIYRYFKEFGDAGIAILVHSLADLRGYDFDFQANPWGEYQPQVMFALLDAYFEKNKLIVSPPKLVTGKDLIALGYVPGPAFSIVLGRIEEAQAEGIVKNRDDALGLARRLFEEVSIPTP
ncbi:MAG: HD domain-containing protein [bacterium]